MKSDKKEISKKDIEWLWKAISINDTQIIHIGSESAIATDGFRFHAINPDNLPSDINGISREWLFKPLENSIIPLPSFVINPKYLIDALSGFVPSEHGTVITEMVGDENFYGIKITGGGDTKNKIAFIACNRLYEKRNSDK